MDLGGPGRGDHGAHRLGPEPGGRHPVGIPDHVPLAVPGHVEIAVPVRDACGVDRVLPPSVAHERRLHLGHQLVVHQEDHARAQRADDDGHGDHVGEQQAAADAAEDHGLST